MLDPDHLRLARGARARAATEDGVGLFHASPRDPIWEYVLSTLLAELCLDAPDQRVCLHRPLARRAALRPPRGRAGHRRGAPRRRRASTSPAASGSSTPAASASRATATRAPPGCCSTPDAGAHLAAHRVRRRRRGRGDPRRPPAGLARRAPGVRSVSVRRSSSSGPRAAALGLRAAALVACGGDRSGADPRLRRAAELKHDLDRRRVGDRQPATATAAAGRRAGRRSASRALPAAVDERLRSAPARGRRQARRRACPTDCQASRRDRRDRPTPRTTTDRDARRTRPRPTPTDDDDHDRRRRRRRRRDADADASRRPTTTPAPPATDDGRRGAERTGEGDGAMSARSLIAGRYELGDRLGVGGMSTVALALDRRLERDVAVKLLAEHLADDPQFVARFRREALAAARLVHPNIVQVFDFGLDEAQRAATTSSWSTSRGQSGARDPARPQPPRRAEARRDRRPGLPRPGLRAPQRRRAPRRQAGQPAALRGRDVSSSPTSASPRRSATSRRSPRSARCSAPPPTSRPSRPHGEEAGPPADLYALGRRHLPAARRAGCPTRPQSLTELALKQQREAPPPLRPAQPRGPAGARAPPSSARWRSTRRAATPSAEEMREALRDGARGIGPTADATRSRRPTRRGDDAPAAAQPPPDDAPRGAATRAARASRAGAAGRGRAAALRRPRRPGPRSGAAARSSRSALAAPRRPRRAGAAASGGSSGCCSLLARCCAAGDGRRDHGHLHDPRSSAHLRQRIDDNVNQTVDAARAAASTTTRAADAGGARHGRARPRAAPRRAPSAERARADRARAGRPSRRATKARLWT